MGGEVKVEKGKLRVKDKVKDKIKIFKSADTYEIHP